MNHVVLMATYFIINAFLADDKNIVLYVTPTFLSIIYFSIKLKNEYIQPSDVILFCYFLFFVIAPIQSISFGYFSEGRPVAGLYFSNSDIIIASAIIFFFITSFGISAIILDKKNNQIEPRNIILTTPTYGFLALLGFISFLLYIPASGGVQNLFLGRLQKEGSSIAGATSIFLSIQVICTFICCSAAWSPNTKNQTARNYSIFLLIILAICQNPFNTARFILISTWAPIGLIAISGKLKTAKFYALAFAAIVFIMPILSITTRSQDLDYGDMSFSNLASKALELPFMDVFDTLCMLVSRTDEIGLNYGKKTISLIFFFIPRSIWENKATLTGLDIGDYLYDFGIAGTSNLSMFVGGDLYADFGLIGPLIGGAIFSTIIHWIFVQRAFKINGHNIKNYILISSLPILIRGPLGATIGIFFIELIVLTFILRMLGDKKTPH